MGIDREAYKHILDKSYGVKAKKPTKYHNRPIRVNGVLLDSQAEARRYSELLLLQAHGKIRDLVIHPRFAFPPGFAYEGDFRYFDSKTGEEIVEDVKGYRTEVFKIKLKCLKYFYPELTFRIVGAG